MLAGGQFLSIDSQCSTQTRLENLMQLIAPVTHPNFIVIGPGKSGTSWLYMVLCAHQQVCMSSAKETLYFENDYGRGPNWYAKFFRHCDLERTRAIGEISNTYIFSPLAAERIAKDFPAMKLIATLRHPAERAFSHFLFLKRNAELNCSFEEALQRRPDIKTRGNYFEHLSHYRQRFSSEQLMILIYDDLKRDVQEYACRLFNFLEIDPIFDPTILERKVLEASEARSRLLAKCTVAAAHIVRRAGFPDLVTRVKNGFFPKLIFRKISRRQEMSTQTYRELCEYYRPDVTRLSEWLGRDLVKLWLDQPAANGATEAAHANPSSSSR